MRVATLILLVLIATALISLILMQQRSGGAGSIFGGGGGGDVYRTRRGFDKLAHYATIALAFLFSVISFSLIFIR